MSIATELEDLQTYLSNAYDKVEDKGGTLPQNKNMYNLANAIDSISTGTIIIIPPSARNTYKFSCYIKPDKNDL